MEQVTVTVKGITPLLMHAFNEENAQGKSPVLAGDRGTPREQADKALHWSQDKKRIIVPGMSMYRSIIAAGKFHKIGKSKVTTLKTSLVPSGIFISEIELPLTPQDWEVDARPVVIPSTGGRIMRFRPRWDEWELEFTLEIDTEMFAPDFVRQLVDDAGKKIGIGDFRPSCKGPFGRFVVTKWQEVK